MDVTISLLISLFLGVMLLILPRFISRIPFVQREGNKNLLDPIRLASKTGQPLRVVCGELHSEGWDNAHVLREIEEASDNGIEISIICGPKHSCGSDGILRLAGTRKNIHIIKVKQWPTEHFRLVENKKIWLEQHHPEGYHGPWKVMTSSDKTTLDFASNKFLTLRESAVKR